MYILNKGQCFIKCRSLEDPDNSLLFLADKEFNTLKQVCPNEEKRLDKTVYCAPYVMKNAAYLICLDEKLLLSELSLDQG